MGLECLDASSNVNKQVESTTKLEEKVTDQKAKEGRAGKVPVASTPGAFDDVTISACKKVVDDDVKGRDIVVGYSLNDSQAEQGERIQIRARGQQVPTKPSPKRRHSSSAPEPPIASSRPGEEMFELHVAASDTEMFELLQTVEKQRGAKLRTVSANTAGTSPISLLPSNSHMMQKTQDPGANHISDMADPSPSSTRPTSLSRSQHVPRRETLPGAYSSSPFTETTRNDVAILSSAIFDVEEPGETNTALAEARPIQNDDLESAQHAELVDPDKQQQKNRRALTNRAAYSFILVGTLLVLGVALLAIFLGSSFKAKTKKETEELSAGSPTPSPTLSLEDQIFHLLPEYTRDRIIKKPDSPQALAYQWILDDPYLEMYSTDRVIQRYALATFFHSTGGPTSWAVTKGWLSYEDHECSWFMSAGFYEDYFNMTFHSPCLREPNPHDPTDVGEVYRYLHTESNGLRGPVPEEAYLLTNLVDLNLGLNNYLSGTISTRVSQLTNLETLSFVLCKASGTIPSEIGLHHATIQNVYFMASQMIGTLPTELGLLTNMVEFDAADNLLTGTLPSQYGNLGKSLEILFFEGQSITGTIPTEYGRLTTVREFGVARNQLMGTMPSQLGLLGRAHYLKTTNNRLKSTIPTQVGLLTSLIQLDLGGNLHTGPIPTELGQLTGLPVIPDFDSYHYDPPRPAGHLINLNLAGNDLTGELPSEIGLLTELELLQLQSNSLSGLLPLEFEELTALALFNLTNNLLSGMLPDAACSLGPEVLSFDCSDSLCGCGCPCNGNRTRA